MYFDNFTIGALVIFVVVLLVFFYLHESNKKEVREQIADMERRLHDLYTEPSVHSREAREMCAAIHHLYPDAVAGEHFALADDGEGPYIKVWMMENPQPSSTELREIVEQHSHEWTATGYQEARLAEYPSVGDQLDALYKARHGDESELQVIDEQIKTVKAQHPNIDAC